MGFIKGNGASSCSYNTTSDRRLKTDIQPMESMIKKIKLLQPVNYKWKIDNTNGTGFIAQDVLNLFPVMAGQESYEEDQKYEDGTNNYYGLDYSKFTPYLTKCTQELITIIELQTIKINTLENNISTITYNNLIDKLTTQENQIDEMKQMIQLIRGSNIYWQY